ncbi:MAG: cupredoxin domain-containing protein [Proteobacteria bacterium]|nr:cupredoxin domain-containing protein [Pseudomonadota bacterium]
MRLRPFALAATLAAFAIPAAAQTAPDWSKAETVTLSMSNYAFAPSTLTLKTNQPYKLVFTSTVMKDHDFNAPELFAAGAIAPEDAGKVSKGTVEVDDGGTVTVRFVPTKPGTYNFDCDHFMHAMMGMKGTAVVQ